MAEDKAAFDRECETRRSDLIRIQNQRVQEFDLLTTTAGLDLIHIIQATEPKTPVDAVPPADLGQPAASISNSPAREPDARKLFRPVSSTSPAKRGTGKDERTSKTVPQYVPVVPPGRKPSPEQPTPETTYL